MYKRVEFISNTNGIVFQHDFETQLAWDTPVATVNMLPVSDYFIQGTHSGKLENDENAISLAIDGFTIGEQYEALIYVLPIESSPMLKFYESNTNTGIVSWISLEQYKWNVVYFQWSASGNTQDIVIETTGDATKYRFDALTVINRSSIIHSFDINPSDIEYPKTPYATKVVYNGAVVYQEYSANNLIHSMSWNGVYHQKYMNKTISFIRYNAGNVVYMRDGSIMGFPLFTKIRILDINYSVRGDLYSDIVFRFSREV